MLTKSKKLPKSDNELSVNHITSFKQLSDQVYNSNYDNDSDKYLAAISCDSANPLEPLIAKIKFGSVQADAMIDSSSMFSLITKTLANKIIKTTPSAKWANTKPDKDLKNFSSEPIEVLGQLATKVIFNDWTCKEACLTVVEDGHKLVIGRDLFNRLGLAVVQQQAKIGKSVDNINSASTT